MPKFSEHGIKLIITTIILLLPYHSIWSQNYIQGKVIDKEGNPLVGAIIELQETRQGCFTNSLGEFSFSGLKPGKYHIQIQLIGYIPQTATLELTPYKNIDTLFQLIPTVLELENILIESKITQIRAKEYSLNIETVDAALLQKHLSPHLLATLSRIPGINYSNLGINIAKPVIRGLNKNRVVVLENGIKQEGQQWGNDHGLEIDPLGMHQIEIIKGPASLIYGAEAMGGIIFFKPPPQVKNRLLETSFFSSFMSLNQGFSNSWSLATQIKNHSVRVRTTTQDYADFQVPATSFQYNRFILPIYNKTLKNTAGKEKHFSIYWDINAKKYILSFLVSHYHQQVGLFAGAMGIPRAYNLLPDNDSRNIDLPYFNTQHTKFICNGKIFFAYSWLEWDIGIQQNLRIEFSQPHAHGRPSHTISNEAVHLNLKTLTLNTRHHWYIKKWHHVIGLNFQAQENNFKGFEFILPHFNNAQIGIWGYSKYAPAKDWVINGGLRADWAITKITAYRDPIFENGNDAIKKNFQNACYSFGISYFPSSSINLKFNTASSFRFPTPSELSIDGMHHGFFRHEKGNSELNTEKGYQFDLSFEWKNRHWLMRATPFFNYFSNYIYLAPSGNFSPLPGAMQIYHYKQAPVIYAGSELTVESHPLPCLHIALYSEYLYTFNLQNLRPLPFIPPNSLLVEAEYTFSKKKSSIWKELFCKIDSRFVADQRRVAQNEWPTSGYSLWNVSIGSEWQYNELQVKITFQVQNLFDRSYLSHLSRYRLINVPEAGRNFVLTLLIIFSRLHPLT
ncbi:MAG: TonB-dependent receptor [Bacteroidia bacterium]|nr:TonB-dependent receptor [Bacteroidia bacterium]